MPTLLQMHELADRIERAYLRRRPRWCRNGPLPQVWVTAAEILFRLHRNDPALPLDPELYVAAQSINSPFDDPWEELTQEASARRYYRRVHRIIRSLREELQDEVHLAEGRVRRGDPIEAVLTVRSRALSPLGCYIVAQRADRPDLTHQFRASAQDQHHSCPLYRQACQRLLSPAAYPVGEVVPGADIPPRAGSKLPRFSSN